MSPQCNFVAEQFIQRGECLRIESGNIELILRFLLCFFVAQSLVSFGLSGNGSCDHFACLGIRLKSSLFGKLFGKRGVFYEMVGQEVSGLDGFYDHEFQEYGEFGIRIPENPGKVCDEIEAATGVQAMIVDANDLNVEILGKASSITLDDETLKGLIRDNPAGQSRELTPFILIREVKEEGETA